MFASFVIGAIIFGYAGYALWKFIKKSKQGKCAACGIKNTCHNKTCR